MCSDRKSTNAFRWRCIASSILILLPLTMLIGGRSVRAATITVTMTTDRVDSGACVSAAPCSLRDAVIYANGHPGTSISVPAGIYTLSIPRSGTNDASTGDLNVTQTTEIIGPGATVNGNGLDRVFDVATTGIVQIVGLTIIGGAVTAPFAACDCGGGILVEQGASLTLTGVTVRGNTAPGGGGIANTGGIVTVQESIISGNAAPEKGGGGVDNGPNDLGGTMTITNSTISGNTGTVNGGVYIGGGIVQIIGSTIADNSADSSGNGITIIGGNFLHQPFLFIRMSTISGNYSYSETEPSLGGGGVTGGIANISIDSSTIAFNRPNGVVNADGGGSVQVRNSIIANNGSSGRITDCFVRAAPSIKSQDYNLADDSSCGLTMPHDQQGVIARLFTLRNNGGATLTHALDASSPAIDAGMPLSGCGGTDQRGISRPQGATCDIGAFEYTYPHPLPPLLPPAKVSPNAPSPLPQPWR